MDPAASGGDGVVASAVELVEIEAVGRLLAHAPRTVFGERELAYAYLRSDPVRRLAARLAAKQAAVRLLGGELTPADVEVVRGEHGPPALRLSRLAAERLAAVGAARALVSLTHERSHAAALVVLLGPR